MPVPIAVPVYLAAFLAAGCVGALIVLFVELMVLAGLHRTRRGAE